MFETLQFLAILFWGLAVAVLILGIVLSIVEYRSLKESKEQWKGEADRLERTWMGSIVGSAENSLRHGGFYHPEEYSTPEDDRIARQYILDCVAASRVYSPSARTES